MRPDALANIDVGQDHTLAALGYICHGCGTVPAAGVCLTCWLCQRCEEEAEP